MIIDKVHILLSILSCQQYSRTNYGTNQPAGSFYLGPNTFMRGTGSQMPYPLSPSMYTYYLVYMDIIQKLISQLSFQLASNRYQTSTGKL